MTSNRVRAVQERRQSNAAGTHGRRPTRAGEIAGAVADWSDELGKFYGIPAGSSPATDEPGDGEAN